MTRSTRDVVSHNLPLASSEIRNENLKRLTSNISGAAAKPAFHRKKFRLGSELIMPDELKNALNGFVRFVKTLHGDEKSEAQSFLDHFFRALGHKGVIEAGATFEFRVAKRPGSPQLELIKGNGAPPPRAKGGKKFTNLLVIHRKLSPLRRSPLSRTREASALLGHEIHTLPATIGSVEEEKVLLLVANARGL